LSLSSRAAGRPDLATKRLAEVRAPTLLIVGSDDPMALALNREALAMLPAERELVVVPGATHLFEEPGKLARGGRAPLTRLVHALLRDRRSIQIQLHAMVGDDRGDLLASEFPGGRSTVRFPISTTAVSTVLRGYAAARDRAPTAGFTHTSRRPARFCSEATKTTRTVT
jgi:hypothetical protein